MTRIMKYSKPKVVLEAGNPWNHWFPWLTKALDFEQNTMGGHWKSKNTTATCAAGSPQVPCRFPAGSPQVDFRPAGNDSA